MDKYRTLEWSGRIKRERLSCCASRAFIYSRMSQTSSLTSSVQFTCPCATSS